jgi:2-(3-amino-3-carboxypropyl)histidine synthase
LTLEQQRHQQQDKYSPPHIYLLGTIQFRPALMEARKLLKSDVYGYQDVTIPQAKPLSPGEVLGCTSPVLTDANETNDSVDAVNGANKCCDSSEKSSHESSCGGSNEKCSNSNTIQNQAETKMNKNNAVVLFIADGRFHLESTMISNPHIPHFYRYDPYGKTLTEEKYDHTEMKKIRYQAIEAARSATTFGIILGTLGRQGNPAILRKIQEQIRQAGKRCFVMLCSEITPAKLALFQQKTTRGTKIDAWVQIACPRLSVDWGHFLSKDGAVPVLSPFELFVCLEATPWREKYPMDFYSEQGGPWSNYHPETKQRALTVVSSDDA